MNNKPLHVESYPPVWQNRDKCFLQIFYPEKQLKNSLHKEKSWSKIRLKISTINTSKSNTGQHQNMLWINFKQDSLKTWGVKKYAHP